MPNPQDLSALTTLHWHIRSRTTGSARQLLNKHTPYNTARDPECDHPATPDIACSVCINLDASDDPTDLIPAAWPCLPVRAVAELASVAIPAELAQ